MKPFFPFTSEDPVVVKQFFIKLRDMELNGRQAFWIHFSAWGDLSLIESSLPELKDVLYWSQISYCQPLTFDFIVKYREYIWWDRLPYNSYISREIKEIFCLPIFNL